MDLETTLPHHSRLLIQNLKFSLIKEKSAWATLKESAPFPKAAVSVILKEDNSARELVMLILKRKEIEGDPWSGHMAFPGGRFAAGDKDIFTTAAREALEETGIDILKCEILGSLHEFVPTNLQIKVLPYVVLSPYDTNVKLDKSEIDQFFWVPLAYFRDEGNVVPYEMVRFGIKAQFPSYKFSVDQVVWGLTFRIIHDLVGLLDKVA